PARGLFLPATAERKKYRNLILSNRCFELRQRLFRGGIGSLRIGDVEGGGAAFRLQSLGVPHCAFRLVARLSRTVFTLKIMNVGIEGSFGVAKRGQHHAVKICESELGRDLRARDARSRRTLIGLPPEDRSEAPEVGGRSICVTSYSGRAELRSYRHVGVELRGLHADAGGRRCLLPFRLPHVGAALEQRPTVADRQDARQSGRSATR